MDLDRIKSFFKDDRYCFVNGIEIVEVTKDYAVCRAQITNSHLNANNTVQGGFTFTLADFAFAVHSNSVLGRWTVSQNVNISYIRPPKGKMLFAKAEPVHIGKSTVLYRVEVYDELNTKVACVTANGYVLGENAALKNL